MMWFVCVSSYSLTITAPSVAIATAIPIVYLYVEASFYGLGAFGRSVGRVVCISDLIEVLSHFTA